MRSLLASAGVALCLCVALHGAAPPFRAVREPLPDGAVARLGHARMAARSRSLNVSPDGRWALCDGGRCFDLVAGKENPTAFHVPDGYQLYRLLSGGACVVRGKDYALLRPNEKPIHFDTSTEELGWMDFDQHGRVGLYVNGDKIRLIDLRQKKPAWHTVATLGPLPPATRSSSKVLLSPAGSHVVWWDAATEQLGVYDVASGKSRTFGGKADLKLSGVDGLAVSPDGQRVAILYSDEATFIDTRTGKQTRRVSVGEFRGADEAWFTPNGKAVVFCRWDKYVVVPADAGERPSHVSLQAGWQGWDRHIRYAPLADSKRLVTLDPYGVLRIRDLKTGKHLDADSRFPAFYGVQALSGHRAASWSRSGTVVVWDVRDGRVLSEMRLKPLGSNKDFFEGMKLSRDGRFVVAWMGERSRLSVCVLAEAATGKVITKADGFVTFHSSGKSVILQRRGEDEKKLVSTSFDLTRREWGRPVELPGEGFYPEYAFAHDGRTFLNANGYAVALHEAVSGKARWETTLVQTDSKLRDRAAVATFARSGRRAVVVRLRDAIVFDVLTGRIVAQVQHRDGEPDRDDLAAVSASGRWLAVAEVYGSPQLYDLEAEQPGNGLLELKLEKDVAGLALNDDGSRLITAHGDGTCLVWDLKKLVKPAEARKNGTDLWELLARTDPVEARPAIVALKRDGSKALKLFAQKLKPAAEVAPARIAELVAELDAEDFDRRTAAERRFAEVGDQAESRLRQAVRKPASVEQARRAETLLKRLDPKNDADHQRHLRALEILEGAATKEAVALLEKLAKGAPAARLTREAKESLQRLKERDD